MPTKRHKPEEIVTKLRQVEVLVGQDLALFLAAKAGVKIHGHRAGHPAGLTNDRQFGARR